MRCVAIGSSADAGSSISRISGSTASARAMHRRCCWPPESASADVCSRSLHLVPERRRLQARLDAAAQLLARARQAVDAQAVGDVVEDRLRKRIRLLEHHADAPPQIDDVDRRRVDVAGRRCGPSPRRARPGTMSFIRLSDRRNVDLPQPDGPMSAVTWFGWILSVDLLEDPVRRRSRSSCPRRRSSAAPGAADGVAGALAAGCGTTGGS